MYKVMDISRLERINKPIPLNFLSIWLLPPWGDGNTGPRRHTFPVTGILLLASNPSESRALSERLDPSRGRVKQISDGNRASSGTPPLFSSQVVFTVLLSDPGHSSPQCTGADGSCLPVRAGGRQYRRYPPYSPGAAPRLSQWLSEMDKRPGP